jgi:hypothetical protein
MQTILKQYRIYQNWTYCYLKADNWSSVAKLDIKSIFYSNIIINTQAQYTEQKNKVI